VTNVSVGLQTPRLKRLAEIVSAQAIAQQEKLEYSQDDINDLSDSEPNGA
jgi:myosin V